MTKASFFICTRFYIECLWSPRASELRDILASKAGFDSPLNCGMGLHVDGWCPFKTRPTDSCTYILADLLTGASLRTDRVSILPWFLDEGPEHCKSTEPFRRQIVDEATELAHGVELYWPLDVDVTYKGEVHGKGAVVQASLCCSY